MKTPDAQLYDSPELHARFLWRRVFTKLTALGLRRTQLLASGVLKIGVGHSCDTVIGDLHGCPGEEGMHVEKDMRCGSVSSRNQETFNLKFNTRIIQRRIFGFECHYQVDARKDLVAGV